MGTTQGGALPTHEARHAAWLELFFDLVFVAIVAQFSHALHGDPGLRDFGLFFALYLPAWWAWVNITVSANLFGSESPKLRLLVLSAMFCLAAMATSVPDALGDRAAAYSLGYAGIRFVLLALWWPATRMAGSHRLPRWRPISYYLLSGIFWALSALLPPPWQYGAWAALIAAEIVLLLAATGAGLPGQLHVGHLMERVGLFVIIVLGESIIALVTSTDHTWSRHGEAVAVLGFILLAALWWSYFDFGTAAAGPMMTQQDSIRIFLLARDIVGFLHFFVTAAVIAISAGLGTAVEEAGHGRLSPGALWALAGGLTLYHAAHALIALRLGRRLTDVACWALPGVGFPLLLALLADSFPPWLLLLLLAAEALAHLMYARGVMRRA